MKTDIQNFMLMLIESDAVFMKEEYGVSQYIVTVNNQDRIQVYFDKDGKFKYMTSTNKG